MSHVGALRISVALRGDNTIPISFNNKVAIDLSFISAISDNSFCQTGKNCEKKVPLVIYHNLSA